MKIAALFDNDGFLTEPGAPHHPEVRGELEQLADEFPDAHFGTASGKPAEFQGRVYAAHLNPGCLERWVIIGNNGAEAWIGLSPDCKPLHRMVYDINRNNAREAILQLNLLADQVVKIYGPYVYEQVNAAADDGTPLMRTIFPVTVKNPQMLMKYRDANGNLRSGIGINPGVAELIEMGLDPGKVPTPEEIFATAQEIMAGAEGEDGNIYALKHDDAAELMPGDMNKEVMLRAVAECLGIPQVDMTKYIDALDCMAKPQNGRAIDKETGLQSMTHHLEIPRVQIESAWDIVAQTPYKEGLDERTFNERMKGPYLAKTGQDTQLNMVFGGDGENDIPGLRAVVVGISKRSCPDNVTKHATHLVGPEAGIRVPTYKTALEVLASTRIAMNAMRRVAG